MDCSIILTIFNEKENIKEQTEVILDVFKKYRIDGEILLVDDGSTDGTKEICDELDRKYKNVRALHHPVNIGRSFAIRTGFDNGKGDVFFVMDSDLQYKMDEIPGFLKKIDEGYDVVSGWRYKRADDPIRRFISRTYNKLIIQRFFGLNVKDQNSGIKALKKEAALNMDFDPEGFIGLHRFLLPLANLKGFSVVEIPVEHYDRPAGRSYIKFYTIPFIVLRDYMHFRHRYRADFKK